MFNFINLIKLHLGIRRANRGMNRLEGSIAEYRVEVAEYCRWADELQARRRAAKAAAWDRDWGPAGNPYAARPDFTAARLGYE